ncbi:hypothetical protein [Dactylosporangium sp. NPDC005555]|uniref:tetratricopeptide repeat protein n=1 Tax=Dactylosporangium sp. NPDC005555 TaxID=3154889 RepID=UPI0033BF392E
MRDGAPAVGHALSTPWRLTLAVTFVLDQGSSDALVPRGDEPADRYTRRVGDLLVRSFAPARARLHAVESGERTEAWCRLVAEDLGAQEARGGPRQDIIAHCSADRSWAVELIRRAVAVATWSLVAAVALGLLTLGAWLVDLVAGTAVIPGIRSGLGQLAHAPAAVPGAVAAGLGIFGLSAVGVPRARKETRRLSRTRIHPLVGAGAFVVFALLVLAAVGAVVFLETWPVAGVGTALRVAVTAGLVPAVCVGLAGHLSRRIHSRAPDGEDPLTPSGELDRILGTAAVRRNWPAAVETFLAGGHEAGIFLRSGGVYQFRHRQLRDWYSRPASPLRAWDDQLALPVVVHGIDMGYLSRPVAAVNAEARPPGVLSRCDIHVVRALVAAEDEARAAGSAVVQPWHLFIALFAGIVRHRHDCPVRLDQVRAAFRTVPMDEAPGHLPLARALVRVLAGAARRWDGRIRPEFLLRDLLDAGDEPAHRAALALRRPVDTEAAVRAWLDDRIGRLRTGQPADTADSLAELADVLLDQLGRAEDAEHALLEGIALEPARPDLLVRLAEMYDQQNDHEGAALVYQRVIDLTSQSAA